MGELPHERAIVLNSVILIEFHEYPDTLLANKVLLKALSHRLPSAKIFGYSRGVSTGFSSAANQLLISRYSSLGVTEVIFPTLNGNQAAWVEAECKKMLLLGTKWSVLNYIIEDVRIGDLVYDSYLRFQNAPTIDLNSQAYESTVRHCLTIFRFWIDYIRLFDVKAIIASHTVYHFGILPRIAIQKSIPVYVFTPLTGNRLDKFSPIPNANTEKYKAAFNLYSQDTQSLLTSNALENIRDRLSGKLGIDRLALRTSPFGEGTGSRVLSTGNRPKVVVFTHCFFDSPHFHGDLLFEDFWEWLVFLGKISRTTNYDWYIKLHPEPIGGTVEIIRYFVKHFSNFTVLPFNTSHLQLVAEGMSCGLTAYGTIGWELPWLGVPVVNACVNGPHAPFSFSHSPASVDELSLLIEQVSHGLPSPNISEVPMFYAMNYDVEKKDWLFTDGCVPNGDFEDFVLRFNDLDKAYYDVERFLTGNHYRIERTYS